MVTIIQQIKNIHRKKYSENNKCKIIEIESMISEKDVRFLKDDYGIAVTTLNNGMMSGTYEEMKKIFAEGLEMIEVFGR